MDGRSNSADEKSQQQEVISSKNLKKILDDLSKERESSNELKTGDILLIAQVLEDWDDYLAECETPFPAASAIQSEEELNKIESKLKYCKQLLHVDEEKWTKDFVTEKENRLKELVASKEEAKRQASSNWYKGFVNSEANTKYALLNTLIKELNKLESKFRSIDIGEKQKQLKQGYTLLQKRKLAFIKFPNSWPKPISESQSNRDNSQVYINNSARPAEEKHSPSNKLPSHRPLVVASCAMGFFGVATPTGLLVPALVFKVALLGFIASNPVGWGVGLVLVGLALLAGAAYLARKACRRYKDNSVPPERRYSQPGISQHVRIQ